MYTSCIRKNVITKWCINFQHVSLYAKYIEDDICSRYSNTGNNCHQYIGALQQGGTGGYVPPPHFKYSVSIINISSFRYNIILLLNYLNTNQLYIICLTETWISIYYSGIFSLCNEADYNLFLSTFLWSWWWYRHVTPQVVITPFHIIHTCIVW